MRKMIYTAIDWLLPHTCLLCGDRSTHQLCDPCHNDLPWAQHCCHQCALPLTTEEHDTLCGSCLSKPPSFDASFAAFRYDFPINQLITQFKYAGNLLAGKLLADSFYRQLSESPHFMQWPSVLVPVPLHWRRQLSRGFNQSRYLAEHISHQTGIPLKEWITRSQATPKQQELSRKERQRNLKNAFTVTHDVKNFHIALVDDVMTTTSTAETLSKLLKRAGAAQVDVWCIARTPSIFQIGNAAGTKRASKG